MSITKSVLSGSRSCLSMVRAQRGLSMMELMIGLGIGLVLTLGMFTMIVSTSQSFRVNDDFSRMQENAATAFRYLADSLRQAGFYGSSQDANSMSFVSGSAVGTTTDCGSGTIQPSANFALSFVTPIRAYMNYTPLSVQTDFPCIRSANFNLGPPIANPNPILVTRGASGFRICWALVAAVPNLSPACTNNAQLLANQPNYATTIYVQADPYSGIVFYGADYATLRASPSALKYTNGVDLELFEYRAHVYYIRACSRPAGGAVNCTGAGDDNGHPIPTLARQELSSSAMTEVPLVEGIELIDYRFGIDNTQDGVADFYTANVVNASDWAFVVSVKITMLVRSPNINTEYDDSGKRYDLLGDGVSVIYRCTNAPAPACKYKRKVFSQTIQVRNIAQRNGA
ncbi:MAG: Tfp pilus assembly protein PilW-like protein [Betaproteobacteria bacterium]|nr:Tfp pilus assembly protein PilW-like protein [Betaproteobacteria bacterium]